MNEFDQLIDIVGSLRDPENGCPWDLKQTLRSLVPNFIEEVYEAVEAIELDDSHALCEELGDIMLHIVMQVRIAEENNDFTMADVLNGINHKLIHRHPHIFGDETLKDADEVKLNWEKIKHKEKKLHRKSILDGIPKTMPGLIKAQRTQEKAASTGFDWQDIHPVLDKLEEEKNELLEALDQDNPDHIREEIGDLLFTIVNLARKLHIDAEGALNDTTRKFERRFKSIEDHYSKNGQNIYESTLEQLDEIWDLVKKHES
ncbi:MAG TPA: nucleoside triphosphate pyrophosphohydrolase [Candidatus Cloacimonadota bacterium]|nr:nucleoside triphosphate pyrophosphohydrolase [Candidatus Cloacimonadota bacterium]